MVGINPNFGQGFSKRPISKVVPQASDNNSQQTLEAQTQMVPTVLQTTVKIPLENLQANAGINLQSNKPDGTGSECYVHLGTGPSGDKALKQWLTNKDAKIGDTFKWNGDIYIIKATIESTNGSIGYVIEEL